MKPSNTEKKRQIGIRAKIFGCFLLFLFLALSILWFAQIILFKTLYKDIKVNELSSTAKYVLSETDTVGFYSNLADAAAKNLICAQVTDEYGDSVYSAENNTYCAIHHLPSSIRYDLIRSTDDKYSGTALYSVVLNPVTSDYDVRYVTNSYTLPESSDAIYVERFSHNGEILYLFLDSQIEPVGTVTKAMASLLIVIGALLVFLALIVAKYVSGVIAGPISEMNKAAKSLSKGKYTPVDCGTKEISELNDTLIKAAHDLNTVERMRTELIANISHDLRTPLTLIKGYAEVMMDIPDEMNAENLKTIADEADRLSSLVNDMLDISKIESGNSSPKLSLFCLTDTVRRCVGSYEKFTKHGGYRILFSADARVYVTADESMIVQALCNLINNAMTYTGSDKSVDIKQSVTGNMVRIEVTDTGEGIEPGKLKLIWDRYYKVDSEHKRAAVGTGLGLSIVRSIITMHNGNYGVRSTLGQGSTFWFELPVSELTGKDDAGTQDANTQDANTQ